MNAAFLRAIQLRQLHRHEEAVAAFLEHLAAFPQDAEAHAELAMTRFDMDGQRRLALESIGAAIALEADEPRFFALKALILARLDRDKEALEASEQALGMDPGLELGWIAKSVALGGLQRWADAETACRKALELDPDNEFAQNQLSMLLRLQDRVDESVEAVARRLERDPEDAFAHANAGWAALQRHDGRKAEEHFLEALRLEPDFEHARIGLREAYKSRSAFYRLYLRWVFFMQKHTQGKQILIIVGIYVGFKFGRALLGAVHPLAAAALLVVYLLFVFWGWLASGIGHFLVLKDPVARRSLTRAETLDGLVVGGGFLLGIVLLVLGATVLPIGTAFVGGALMAGAVPASLVFDNESRIGRLVFGALAALIYAAGIAALVQDLTTGNPMSGIAAVLVGLGALAAVGSTWLGMVPALRRRTAD